MVLRILSCIIRAVCHQLCRHIYHNQNSDVVRMIDKSFLEVVIADSYPVFMEMIIPTAIMNAMFTESAYNICSIIVEYELENLNHRGNAVLDVSYSPTYFP